MQQPPRLLPSCVRAGGHEFLRKASHSCNNTRVQYGSHVCNGRNKSMKKTVLIVEDEPDCATLLSYRLQREGYETVIASSGEEAIDAAQCSDPDALLLDIMLPALDGWEVCRILRESSKGKFLPIIMLTALTDEEAKVKSLTLGADDFVTKPYSVSEVLLKLRNHIERRRMMLRLRAGEVEQQTALRYVVHELRNSLSAIGGFSSLALRQDDPPRYLKTIHAAAAHAASLLNDTSLLLRLEKQAVRLDGGHVALAPLLEEAIALMADSAARSQVSVVVVSRTAAAVRGEPMAIRQVLLNLLANAIRFNRTGGRVWIHCQEDVQWAELSVTDEGRGIARSEWETIFAKFSRGSNSDDVKGEGLGLYLVKLLMEAMGGSVAVASRPGTGSTFTVSFRKTEAHPAETRSQPSGTQEA